MGINRRTGRPYPQPVREEIRGGLIERLAARDRLTCYLCEGPVDMLIAAPAPMSPTLDHVVPKRHGGRTVPSNLKLAHRSCNSWKGDLDAATAVVARRGWRPQVGA